VDVVGSFLTLSLGCHRVRFLLCIPSSVYHVCHAVGERNERLPTHAHTHDTVCKNYRCMEIAESRKKHSCLVVPGTARYQYHLFQQDNIVGPTWPWPGPGRSLARSQVPAPSKLQKGKSTVVGRSRIRVRFGNDDCVAWEETKKGRAVMGLDLTFSFLSW
jgi:hypothetical protein